MASFDFDTVIGTGEVTHSTLEVREREKGCHSTTVRGNQPKGN